MQGFLGRIQSYYYSKVQSYALSALSYVPDKIRPHATFALSCVPIAWSHVPSGRACLLVSWSAASFIWNGSRVSVTLMGEKGRSLRWRHVQAVLAILQNHSEMVADKLQSYYDRPYKVTQMITQLGKGGIDSSNPAPLLAIVRNNQAGRTLRQMGRENGGYLLQAIVSDRVRSTLSHQVPSLSIAFSLAMHAWMVPKFLHMFVANTFYYKALAQGITQDAAQQPQAAFLASSSLDRETNATLEEPSIIIDPHKCHQCDSFIAGIKASFNSTVHYSANTIAASLLSAGLQTLLGNAGYWWSVLPRALAVGYFLVEYKTSVAGKCIDHRIQEQIKNNNYAFASAFFYVVAVDIITESINTTFGTENYYIGDALASTLLSFPLMAIQLKADAPLPGTEEGIDFFYYIRELTTYLSDFFRQKIAEFFAENSPPAAVVPVKEDDEEEVSISDDYSDDAAQDFDKEAVMIKPSVLTPEDFSTEDSLNVSVAPDAPENIHEQEWIEVKMFYTSLAKNGLISGTITDKIFYLLAYSEERRAIAQNAATYFDSILNFPASWHYKPMQWLIPSTLQSREFVNTPAMRLYVELKKQSFDNIIAWLNFLFIENVRFFNKPIAEIAVSEQITWIRRSVFEKKFSPEDGKTLENLLSDAELKSKVGAEIKKIVPEIEHFFQEIYRLQEKPEITLYSHQTWRNVLHAIRKSGLLPFAQKPVKQPLPALLDLIEDHVRPPSPQGTVSIHQQAQLSSVPAVSATNYDPRLLRRPRTKPLEVPMPQQRVLPRPGAQ